MDFKDKIVLVTGASRGLGKVIALDFAAQGAKVVLVGRHLRTLEDVEDDIVSRGGDAMSLEADISNATAVQALAMEVGLRYGRIDILINNAAVAYLKPLVQVTQDEWEEMTGVNLHGMFAVTQTFLPGMIERKSGVIINVSAAIARNGFPNLAVYSATKAGILAFTEALSKEVRRYGVQVYAVMPHGINTNLYQTLFGATDPTKILSPERVSQDIMRVADGEGGIRSGQTLEISV